ncbi:MAG TPA: GNAT family N-acetyltransferase [Vicinamibacterales bacterium]|nr:GNAT family N-acetyltransferase [Vicinamibacterales bacterium]
MAEIERFRPDDDRRALEMLYRRVFGNDAAEASRLRWEWQYRRNPSNPNGHPIIYVAREGPTLVGQYGTMPVRLHVLGREIDASWGIDLMVAPERQRQGIGEALFRVWDRHTGASLGLAPSESSKQLLRKLRWPGPGPVPCLIKPLTRRAVKQPNWPESLNNLVSAVTLPIVKIVARTRPLRAQVETVRRFPAEITAVWERAAPKFDLAVRRDAPYLNWRFIEAPHVRYSVALLKRDQRTEGYVVYRHLQAPRSRVTNLVDFLVDPDDEEGFSTLLRWVDREARAADSDKVRTYALHAGFRRQLRKSGYFSVRSAIDFVVKVNGLEVPAGFYEKHERWHVTLGDSDVDR